MWNSYPILRPTIAVLLGMIGVNILMARVHYSIYITFSLFALAVGAAVWLFYKKSKRQSSSKTLGGISLAAFFFFGAVMAQWRFLSVEARTADSHKCRIGIVDSAPVEKEKWWVFQFAEEDGSTYMAYLSKGDTANHERPELLKGDSIWLVSYFDMPTSPYLKAKRQREMDNRQRMREIRKKINEAKKYARKAEREAKKKLKQQTKSDSVSQHQKSDYKKPDSHKKTSKKKNKQKEINANHTDSLSVDANDSAEGADASDSSDERDKYNGYSNYLFFKGISSVIYCSEGAWGYYYENQSAQQSYRQNLQNDKDIATRMHEQYALAGFTDEAQAIVDAMTTGNKSEITHEMRQQFSNAGISHVLALSGFHLTVIVALIDVLLLRGLFSRRWKRITALVVIPFIWLFAYIAGFPPSLVRATIMCSVFQIALVIGHGQQLKNAAAIAGFFMICFNPMLIMDVGFQLSFLSIVGIAVMGAPLCTWFGQKTGRWSILIDVMTISFTCTLFTFPVVAYHFGQVPIYSLISNLFVSVIATLIMWAAVLWWMFSWWSTVCGWLTSVLNVLTASMVFVAQTVSRLPMATVQYSPNIYEVILLYFVITLLLIYAYNKKRKYICISVVSLLLVPVVHFIV